jgi:hypothetical protein
MLGDNNGDGKVDLFQVHHNKTRSNNAEVKVFDGDSNFTDTLSKWITEQPTYVGFGPSAVI